MSTALLFFIVAATQAQTSRPHTEGTVCVVDTAASSRLRVFGVGQRASPDSIATRNGARERRTTPNPPVVGYGVDLRGLRADTVTEAGGEWTEWIRILDQRYSPFGRARALPLERVTRIGEVQGVSVFIERGLDLRSAPEVVYLLNSDCLFQPYVSPEGMR